MSEPEFAAMLGINPKDYLDYERGMWGASLYSVLDIARTLKLHAEILISATETFLVRDLPLASASLAQGQLFRLASIDADGTVRDADIAYDTIDQACRDVALQNALRRAQGKPPFLRLSAYVLLGRMMISPEQDEAPAET
jgi:hypothetical protein